MIRDATPPVEAIPIYFTKDGCKVGDKVKVAAKEPRYLILAHRAAGGFGASRFMMFLFAKGAPIAGNDAVLVKVVSVQVCIC